MSLSILSVSLFCVLLIGVGFFYRKRIEVSDYHIANRQVGLWRIAASTFTLMGGGELVTVTVFAYMLGFWALSLFLGFSAGLWAFSYFFKNVRQDAQEKDLHTLPDYFHHYFGRTSGCLAFLFSMLAVGALLIVQLIVGGGLISSLTGWDAAVSTAVIAVTITIYVFAGGFNSILVTDIIQAISIFIALLVILFTLDLPVSEAFSSLVLATEESFPWADSIGLFLAGVLSAFGATDIWQRVYAGRSTEYAQNGMRFAALGIFIFALIMTLITAGIKAQLPDVDPNNAFFIFLEQGFNDVLGSVLAILLVAAIFSTADTELFLLSILTEKEYKRIRHEKARLNSWVTRSLMLGVIIIAYSVSLKVDSLIDVYLSLVFFFMVLGPIAIARFFNRGNNRLATIAMIANGLILSVLIAKGHLGGLWPLLATIPSIIVFIPRNRDDLA